MTTQLAIAENSSLASAVLDKTLTEVIQEFLKERYSSKNTLAAYSRYLLKYANFLRITTLAGFTMVAYSDVRKLTNDFVNGFLSPNTKRVIISCLRSFWAYIVDCYGYHKNPVAQKINLPARQSKSKTKSLDQDSLVQGLAKLSMGIQQGHTEHLTYVLSVLLASTSLRISEALQVTVEMVIAGKVVVVQKQARSREIELPIKTRDILLAYIAKHTKTGLVFTSADGVSFTRNYAHKIIKKALGVAPHGLRKSAIEILIKNGVHQHEVAKVSGHTSINMVYYYDNKGNAPSAQHTLGKILVK